jgi:light-independent protochlorophyllide reductase subunit B
MGLEEHLLTMFREDFEFHDEAGPSHHAAHSPGQKNEIEIDKVNAVAEDSSENNLIWLKDAEKELRKIPFFVRGKARKNTEKYAQNNGFSEISIETLYEAKAHYAR